VLSTGVLPKLSELPHGPCETPDQARRLLAAAPRSQLHQLSGTYLRAPQSPRLRKSLVSQPTVGIVQDYAVLESPPQPASRRRTSWGTAERSKAASFDAGPMASASETHSRALNILAVCGALLTVAALVYIAADLLSWF